MWRRLAPQKPYYFTAKKSGFLNPEGESEGFCRDVSRSNKPTWLANVLSRDMKIDPELEAARTFASDLRLLMRQANARSIKLRQHVLDDLPPS